MNCVHVPTQSLPNRSERVVQCQIIDQKYVPRVRLISFLPKNAKNLRRLRSDGKLPIIEWFFLITVNYLKLWTKQRMYPHRLYDDQGRFLVENRTRLMHSGRRFSKFVYVDILNENQHKINGKISRENQFSTDMMKLSIHFELYELFIDIWHFWICSENIIIIFFFLILRLENWMQFFSYNVLRMMQRYQKLFVKILFISIWIWISNFDKIWQKYKK